MRSIAVFPCSPEMLERFERTFVAITGLSAVLSVIAAQTALALLTCRALMQRLVPCTKSCEQ